MKTKTNAATKPSVIESKRSTAITQSPTPISMEIIGKSFLNSLESLTGAIQHVKDEELAAAYRLLVQLKGVQEALQDVVKHRIQKVVKATGEVTTEKGGMEASVGDTILRMRLWRTGVDANKFETMLRGKGLDPSAAMDAKVTYSYSETKAAVALASNRITQDEVESCYYEEKWVVTEPKM